MTAATTTSDNQQQQQQERDWTKDARIYEYGMAANPGKMSITAAAADDARWLRWI